MLGDGCRMFDAGVMDVECLLKDFLLVIHCSMFLGVIRVNLCALCGKTPFTKISQCPPLNLCALSGKKLMQIALISLILFESYQNCQLPVTYTIKRSDAIPSAMNQCLAGIFR